MSFVDSIARITPRLTPSLTWGLAMVCGLVLLATLVFNHTPPGAAPTVQAVAPANKASAPVVAGGPQWQELSQAHQKILHPLAGTWNSLGPNHKAKWIALATNYPSRSPEVQAKLQSRMAKWAALTPQERELARLNYAEYKKLSPAERAAEWAAYQELSSDEKKQLAAKGPRKPVGAAVAVTPTAGDKLTVVPVTRRSGQLADSATPAKSQIDPNTLLPKLIIPQPPADNPPEVPTNNETPGINSDTLSPN